jgi:hypothetical protein
MVTQYEILEDSRLERKAVKGAIVYKFVRYDYGLASDDTRMASDDTRMASDDTRMTSDDTRMTSVPHVSVTLDPEGGYPSFTVPETAIREIKI